MNFLALLPSLIQSGVGMAQLFGGLAGRPNRPSEPIPKAETEALDTAKRLATQTKLPGQDIYETQLGEKTAQMVGNLKGTGAAGLGALSNIYAQEMGARRNLAADAARYYAGNQGQLIGQLGNMARWQDKIWQENIGNKYQEQAAAASALTQAGISNAFSGLNNIAGTYSYNNLYKNLLGGNQNKPLAGIGSFGGNANNVKTTTSFISPILQNTQGYTPLFGGGQGGSLFNPNYFQGLPYNNPAFGNNYVTPNYYMGTQFQTGY